MSYICLYVNPDIAKSYVFITESFGKLVKVVYLFVKQAKDLHIHLHVQTSRLQLHISTVDDIISEMYTFN